MTTEYAFLIHQFPQKIHELIKIKNTIVTCFQTLLIRRERDVDCKEPKWLQFCLLEKNAGSMNPPYPRLLFPPASFIISFFFGAIRAHSDSWQFPLFYWPLLTWCASLFSSVSQPMGGYSRKLHTLVFLQAHMLPLLRLWCIAWCKLLSRLACNNAKKFHSTKRRKMPTVHMALFGASIVMFCLSIVHLALVIQQHVATAKVLLRNAKTQLVLVTFQVSTFHGTHNFLFLEPNLVPRSLPSRTWFWSGGMCSLSKRCN